MADPRREKWKRLASVNHSILPIREMARLNVGRARFQRLLREELLKLGKELPDDIKSSWVVSQDFGRLVDLWKASMSGFQGPALAHDILALHGLLGDTKPRIYNKSIVRDLMDPREAYVLPVSDCRGNHLATVIHVGPDARDEEIRRLAKSLIRDPTGRTATA